MATTIETHKKPHLITLDTIEPQTIKWLWYPYIPAGTVTALFGQGGMGKSFITCDIAARLSQGIALPGAQPPACPQKVLMLSAEDDYPTVLVPRLIKQGANRANIAVPDFKFTLDPWGAKQVSELMRDFAATVVFVDPIVYYAGGKMDMNRSNEVRAMMEGLKTAAEQSESSVIIVGHTKKSQDATGQDRMMGSADWINAARSALMVDKTNDGTKVLRHVKTNYGAIGEARAYSVEDDGLVWGDVYEDDDMPAQTAPKRKDAAIAFIRDMLKDGPVLAVEVEARAKDEGIAPATLNRAKVGVAESVFSKGAGTWVWRLLERPGNPC